LPEEHLRTIKPQSLVDTDTDTDTFLSHLRVYDAPNFCNPWKRPVNERLVIGLQSYNLFTFYTIPSYKLDLSHVFHTYPDKNRVILSGMKDLQRLRLSPLQWSGAWSNPSEL